MEHRDIILLKYMEAYITTNLTSHFPVVCHNCTDEGCYTMIMETNYTCADEEVFTWLFHNKTYHIEESLIFIQPAVRSYLDVAIVDTEHIALNWEVRAWMGWALCLLAILLCAFVYSRETATASIRRRWYYATRRRLAAPVPMMTRRASSSCAETRMPVTPDVGSPISVMPSGGSWTVVRRRWYSDC